MRWKDLKEIFLRVCVDDIVVLSATSIGLKIVTSKFQRLYKIRLSDSVSRFLEFKLQRVSEPNFGSRLLALS